MRDSKHSSAAEFAEATAPAITYDLIQQELKAVLASTQGLRSLARAYSDHKLVEILAHLGQSLERGKSVVLPEPIFLLGIKIANDPHAKRLIGYLKRWDEELRGPLAALSQTEISHLACALLWQTALIEEFEIRSSMSSTKRHSH